MKTRRAHVPPISSRDFAPPDDDTPPTPKQLTIDQKLSKLSHKQLILLGFTVAGVASIIMLVKEREKLLKKFKAFLRRFNIFARRKSPKKLSECRFGYQDM